MIIFLQYFLDVSRHGDVNSAIYIIPFKRNAAVQVARPIFGKCTRLFNACHQTLNIIGVDKLDTKVIDNDCK
jgi:hypothetical protein